MQHLDNIYDPTLPEAKVFIMRSEEETVEQAWERQQHWLEGKVIGEPKETAWYTVEQLKAKHMVGVYQP